MKQPPKVPSDRSFCITFAVVFAILGAWLVWKSRFLGVPALAVAASFLLIGVIAPQVLHPLNVAWMRLGLLLNMVVSPIIMGLIYFGVFTPVSLFFRLRGRDALRRRYEPSLSTYWIDRTPPGPEGDSLPRQF